jgi:AraC family transcriptional regulator
MPRAAARRAPTSLAWAERVNLAIDHVVTHMAAPLRLADVARAAHLSPFHFHRVFQAMTGETLADFVKRQRLARALRLMAQSPRPTFTQIALACGFSSSSDFSRCFRQRFGAAPRAFDLAHWRRDHRAELLATLPAPREPVPASPAGRVPAPANPDGFRVELRDLPARTVAYIRVLRPYRGDAVLRAARRLEVWAERQGLADGQWLGYQWENPELVALDHCSYCVAVEAPRFTPHGEIGRYRFPPMRVAQVELRGGVDLELRALDWLFGAWLPASGWVPDDQPAFEAWIGRPFAHGVGHFELHVQLPVRRA